MPRRKSRAMIEQIKKHHDRKVPIRKIAESLGISRNTVRRYLKRICKSDEAGSEASDNSSDSVSITSAVEDDLELNKPWLKELPWSKIVEERRRGITITNLFKEYQPKVGYTGFRRALYKSLKEIPEAFPRIQHEPGFAVQIDFADGLHIKDPKTGALTKTQFFCGVLPFSSYTFGEFVENQKLKTFIRVQERMFQYFKGVPKYVVPDNLKSAVSRADRYDPDLNPAYHDFSHHVGFTIAPARPRRPRDKGAVEAAIGVIQRSFYQEQRNTTFYSLEELNAAFKAFLELFNQNVMRERGVSRQEMFTKELPKLNPLPTDSFEIIERFDAQVHADCCVQVKRNFYSVPFTYVGQVVFIKLGLKILEVINKSGETIAVHTVVEGQGNRQAKENHYPPQKVHDSAWQLTKYQHIASRIGPQASAYIEALYQSSDSVTALKKILGAIKTFEAEPEPELCEKAAEEALKHNNLRLIFLRGALSKHRALKLSPPSQAPTRDPINSHVRSEL